MLQSAEVFIRPLDSFSCLKPWLPAVASARRYRLPLIRLNVNREADSRWMQWLIAWEYRVGGQIEKRCRQWGVARKHPVAGLNRFTNPRYRYVSAQCPPHR